MSGVPARPCCRRALTRSAALEAPHTFTSCAMGEGIDRISCLIFGVGLRPERALPPALMLSSSTAAGGDIAVLDFCTNRHNSNMQYQISKRI